VYHREPLVVCPPNELLCVIFSFLDIRTLCTVRLSNKLFCQLASERIEVLRVDATSLEGHPDENFQRFPAAKVQVYNTSVSSLSSLGREHISTLVGSINMAADALPVLPADAGSTAVLAQLPNLTSFSTVQHLTTFPTLPTSLQVLTLGRVEDASDMSAICRLTQLTRLQLSYELRNTRPLHMLGHLKQLKHLRIRCYSTVLSCISPLANLETLIWSRCTNLWDQFNEGSFARLEPLLRLCNLSSFSIIEGPIPVQLPIISDLSVLTGLTSLGLSGVPCPSPLARAMSNQLGLLLPHLPHLQELAIPTFSCIDSFVGTVPFTGLRSLVLQLLPSPGVNTVAILSECAALTHLEVLVSSGDTTTAHIEALAGLSSLRSLSMCGDELYPCPSPAPVLQALTGLTALSVRDWALTDQDVAVCSGLTSLRELQVLYEPLVTNAALPHLKNMFWLSALELNSTGIGPEAWTADVMLELNEPRLARGWPALAVDCHRDLQWPKSVRGAPWLGPPNEPHQPAEE
jgi:hypothetical protein